jgi:hypothetical protein
MFSYSYNSCWESRKYKEGKSGNLDGKMFKLITIVIKNNFRMDEPCMYYTIHHVTTNKAHWSNYENISFHHNYLLRLREL